jgi:hypothetical protein
MAIGDMAAEVLTEFTDEALEGWIRALRMSRQAALSAANSGLALH